MGKWLVSINWEKEYESDDEGDALLLADADFNLMNEARAEEIETEEE